MAFRFVRSDDGNRSEQNIEVCLEGCLYKLCERTGEGGSQRSSDTSRWATAAEVLCKVLS